MRYIFTFIFLLYGLSIMSQDIFVSAEPIPAYPGGEKALTKFIKDNLVYPEFAQIKGIEGQVIIQFNIALNGDVVNIRINKSLESSCDSAVIKMMKTMPRWIPVNKNKLSDEIILPVNFTLPTINSRKIYHHKNLDQLPFFPDGEQALYNFIQKNLKYPIIEHECFGDSCSLCPRGRVTIRFIVTKEGKIESPEIIRGLTPLLDKEALRIINLMPSWIPAKQKGENVDAFFILPIVFRL